MTLKLASRGFEGFERSFAHQIASFRETHPEIEVSCEFLEITQHHQKMIADGGALRGEADLLLCVTDWLPEAIAGGMLCPLNEFIAKDAPEGWPDAWSPSMRLLQTSPDGQVYGLPYHDGPEIFMYRSDLFEDPSERALFQARCGFELGPPRTWEQFVEIAKFFTRPDQGLWGTCLAGFPDHHNNVYDFMIQLWSRGGQLLDAEGQPRFHEGPGEEALRFIYDLYHTHRVLSPGCLKLDSVASGLYYADGNAAMMWNWSGFAALAEIPQVSKIVGNNACAGIPGGVSLNIYWVLSITSGCKHKEEAYQFLRHVAGPEMDKATSMLGGNGTRLSTWRDEEVRAKFPYYRIIEEVHQNVESPPRIAEFPAMAETLSQMVDDVMHQRAGIKETLDRAAREVRDRWRP